MFDVAFSFAGEERDYVEKTVHALEARGVKVFYDRNQEVNLWGKDLYQYLSDVYQHQAKYCVTFLSRNYAAKAWTKHELKIIQARAFQEAREYILPARFDDTEIPGLLPTIAYIDLNQYSPESLADLIAQKVVSDKPIEVKNKPKAVLDLEVYLADAVVYAEEYLKPDQSVGSHDRIAELVRRSFRMADLKPEVAHLKPYLRSKKAEYRVVGYLGFQINPTPELMAELVICLNREREEARQRKETRPLWQLLVCFTSLLKKGVDSEDKELIRDALFDFNNFLRSDSSIDPGGECKRRIEWLINQ
jgi:hypothetical protein